MRIQRKFVVALLVFAGFLSLSSAACRYNWTLYSRLNMLVRGYVFCEVETPPKAETLRVLGPMGFVSGLVYCNGTYVGSLDRNGAFRVENETRTLPEDREAKISFVLFVFQYVFGAIFVGGSVGLLWKGSRNRGDRGQS